MYMRFRVRSGAYPKHSDAFAVVFISACLSTLSASAFAQTVQELPPVVVEGATLDSSRPDKKPAKPKSSNAAAPKTGNDGAAAKASSTDTSQSTDGVPIEQIGAAVSVVTRKDLDERQIRYVADALRGMPGVAVSSPNGPGGLTQVRLRGAEANHTLVLIDGIEANNPTDGEFDFGNLDAADVERIEVIRGAMSGIYGSSAVGGVINIVTRSGRGPLTFTGRTEGGSLGTSDVSGSASAGNGKGHFALNYHRQQSEGFNVSPEGGEPDSWQLSTFSFRGGMNVSDGLSVNFAFRNMRRSADRDGFGGTTGELATSIDDPSTLGSDTWLAGVNVRWDTLGGHLTHEVRATRNAATTTDLDMSFPAAPFHTRNESEDIKYGYLTTLKFATPSIFAEHSVTGLAEHESERFTPAGDFADGVERSQTRQAMAIEYRGGFGNTVFLTANVRHDDSQSFDDFTTWRSAISVPLRNLGLRPHASAGTAVKFPSMFELYGSIPGFFTPNPNLKPEESFSWDAGVEYTIARGLAMLDVTYFNADLKNEIVTLGFPYSLQNADGTSTREGIEVALRAKLSESLTLGAAYTYLDAKNELGEEAPRRAPHSGRIDANYVFAGDKANINFAAVYNGRQEDLAFRLPAFTQERVALNGYWLATVAASYRLRPGAGIFARVENLFDDDYQQAHGYATAGATVFAGMRFSYVEDASIAWSEGR
ncbi:vitamin B12 transporter [Hyphomicrobium sp. 1Nfss2.1]|uniref:TonB-dependent receptor plug domain-containing protein n=1 Tax=Hyphomicrobium sp. 1Nfss2.1 TaxID=3413936 RepID=UPI003C7DACD3